MPRLRLNAVSKTFAHGKAPVRALDDLSLEVADGELLAIVGPSGSGKTTTLRTIAGLEKPDTGQVFFGDREMGQVAVEDRNIGYVFQQGALFSHLRVYDNLAYGLRSERLTRAERERRVRETASLLRIEPLLTRRVRDLSGGQQQRVAVARALATEPAILLLDEPFSGVDAPLRAELRGELARVHRKLGCTTLFVTHDQSDAMALGHRLAVMDRGRILQIGTPREVYAQPASLDAARFVGTPQISVVPAEFLEMRRGVVLGVRAEDVHLHASGSLRGVVRAVEDLGSTAFVHLEWAGGSLAARADALLPRAGELVTFDIDRTRLHIFDAVTGCRLEAPVVV